jgi:hypothetical protein
MRSTRYVRTERCPVVVTDDVPEAVAQQQTVRVEAPVDAAGR